ncbi:hypothetical protein IF2G_06874 [Cordyceps javanica]|nr:hypothetical protein IF2G_06874 [Cordyceps javanica]
MIASHTLGMEEEVLPSERYTGGVKGKLHCTEYRLLYRTQALVTVAGLVLQLGRSSVRRIPKKRLLLHLVTQGTSKHDVAFCMARRVCL